jgi:FKBP-type peptidyl-prolyl cis-trans isomerase
MKDNYQNSKYKIATDSQILISVNQWLHFLKLDFSTLIIFLLLSVFNYSCKENKTPEKHVNPAEYKESLMKVNKKMVKSEDEQIEDYIARYGWRMKKTGTGLRYMIYKQGSGPTAEKGKVAKIFFSVSLLNGDICYTSESEGPKEFLIGQGGVESGLEEGILFLKKGDRAKFILPSHLAFGLVGDTGKIPAKATLVYDIELLELN